jgi:predicted acylesterase/phospholipase RssA
MTAHPKSAELAANMRLAGQKALNLALQGGGSHSAFTWGVLDRLLEDERLTFDGISATSAGCVNAVLLADGLASGGRQAAKDLLKVFWRKISDLTSSSFIAPSLFDKYNPTFGLEHSPGYLFVDMVSRFISPYQLNRLGESAFAPVTTRIALSPGTSSLGVAGAAAVTPSLMSTKQELELLPFPIRSIAA